MTIKRITLSILSFTLFTASLHAEKLTVDITPGKNWTGHNPQCAIWLETSDGTYLKTVFVTASASKGKWKFAPKGGRPESLPVWYFSSKVSASEYTDSSFDAVTSATPKKIFSASTDVSFPKNDTLVIKAEFNRSFDYDETWTNKNSGANGQPSIIYSAEIKKNGAHPIKLEPCAAGPVSGIGPSNEKRLENLTSAKQIVSEITAYLSDGQSF